MAAHQEVGRKSGAVALGLRRVGEGSELLWLRENIQSLRARSCFLDIPSYVMEIPLTFSMQG